MEEIDELVEKIKAIKEDLKREKTYNYISEKYGITLKEVIDIKYLTEDDLKSLRESIEEILHKKDKGMTIRKISADLGIGNDIVAYILNELGYDPKEKVKLSSNSIIELEKIWRAHKSGESIERIAAVFGYSYEGVEVLITSFDKRIEQRRKTYDTRRGKFNEEEERKKLQKYFGVSAELIDYMLKGTPITHKKSEKGNMGEDERDEL